MHTVFFASAGLAMQLATTAFAILFLFTQWSPIPAVTLSVLAIVAAGVGKTFGSACFAFGHPWWTRLGGLVVAVVCAAVTIIPFSIGLTAPIAPEVAWHFVDSLFGLAPGTIKPIYAAVLATLIEGGGIGFLWLSGSDGQRYMQAEQAQAVA